MGPTWPQEQAAVRLFVCWAAERSAARRLQSRSITSVELLPHRCLSPWSMFTAARVSVDFARFAGSWRCAGDRNPTRYNHSGPSPSPLRSAYTSVKPRPGHVMVHPGLSSFGTGRGCEVVAAVGHARNRASVLHLPFRCLLMGSSRWTLRLEGMVS
jgi:hypothetical protein